MLGSQSAVPTEVGVQKSACRDVLIDSPDITTAEPLDQKHVLERFVFLNDGPAHVFTFTI